MKNQNTQFAEYPEIRTATFSRCRRYRYELWRRWAEGPYCMFIGLNPSTADETTDDRTVGRCIDYAQRWGYSALCMTNIFAWRDTKPALMKKAVEPIGQENDSTLLRLASDAGIAIAAWGGHGCHLGRDKAVMAMLPKLHCLKITKSGAPNHPLYLKATLKPLPFTAA